MKDIFELSETYKEQDEEVAIESHVKKEFATVDQRYDSLFLEKMQLKDKQMDELAALNKTTNEIVEITNELARLDGVRNEIFIIKKPKNKVKKCIRKYL